MCGLHILLIVSLYCMWTLTFQGGRAAPGQLECVSISAERLLLVAVQKFPEWAEAPLSTTQNVLSCLRLHDLTVLVVHHSFILKSKDKRLRSSCPEYADIILRESVTVLQCTSHWWWPNINSLPPPQRTWSICHSPWGCSGGCTGLGGYQSDAAY